MKNLRCEQFVYEGRGGNNNQFDTLSDCERFCSPQPGTQKYVTSPTTTSVRPPAPASVPVPQPPIPQPPLRPVATEPVRDKQTIEDILDYDEKVSYKKGSIVDELLSNKYGKLQLTQFVDASDPASSNNVPPSGATGNSIDNRGPSILGPDPPAESVSSPGSQPKPPAVQAAKTVVHKERIPETSANKAAVPERRKEIYKAEPLPSKPPATGNENLPIVGPSPPMSVNYQTGEVKNKASGIRTFLQSNSRAIIEDSDLTEGQEDRKDSLSCPNGLQELRYADGRPVMCLPGKNQCPEKSVCFFNGMDFFCCPNEEDPYDKHVFGGYGGEEIKHGYKVFGPLNIRRLMDEVPLRVRRQARSIRTRRQASSNIFSSAPAAFNIDSITAPLRFDDEKPRTVSRAQRMRVNPAPPHHGNPICIEPLVTGDCAAAHLRYYYDRDSDKCRLFYYTGCKGNNNNFGSIVDCQRLCVLGGQRPRPESADSTPPPILQGQCPDGKTPLGGSAPVLCGNTTDSIGCPAGYYCLHGPPDVCCANSEPEERIPSGLEKKVEKESVRFAPEVRGVPRAHARNILLSTPKYMCPDASDPLMASNGEPIGCGAGFDGMKLCPKGFYCAIDVEKQSRMCCPLYGAAERVPTEQGSTPYLGRRPSNPGEVLERGSLPSDQSEFITKAMKEKMQERKRQKVETTTSVFAEESEELEDDMEDEEDENGMAHLMLKPAEAPKTIAATGLTTALPESEDEHIIDLPTEPPAVEEMPVAKTVEDKSVCHIKPSEGRACREDEVPPRTNLHYFYSPKDRRCKLYFYRGCGGNANRFEKKADCERLCLS
ncbi:Kunitz/Bovine pancreatic trypsin inhibitor domain protein [Cooperia oncophora]